MPPTDADLGPDSGPCPICDKPVARPLLAGHLLKHDRDTAAETKAWPPRGIETK